MNGDKDPVTGPITPLSPTPRVRLADRGREVAVIGSATAAGRADEPITPFPLPKLPRGLLDRAADLLVRVWQLHRRCAATVLLLDARARTWSIAVPQQRCGLASASWDAAAVAAADVVDRPQGPGPLLLSAGSVQARVQAAGEDPADAVPPDDGLHLVLALTPEGGRPYAARPFMRVAGAVRAVPAGEVLADDAADLLRHARPRLRLA